MIVAVFGFAPGCDTASTPPSPISELRIGVLPDESPEVLTRNYGPLLKHLEAVTGLKCTLVIPESYEALVDQFRTRHIDLAHFGGVTFVQAEHQAGAVPLVLRQEDLNFTSFFIVRADNPAVSIADLKGSVFCFGSRLSTSGHFMPRRFLHDQGIDPESFFGEVRYCGMHDETISRVRDGYVDAGAVNAVIFEALVNDGRVTHDDMRIVAQTEPYANYVWAVQPELSTTVQMQLREGFLKLSHATERHREILRGLNTTGYLPASTGDFQDLSQIVSAADAREGRP